MSPKANTFTKDLNSLHEHLADLNHYQSFVHWQLGNAKEGLRRSLDYMDKRGLKNEYFTATGLSLFNIFHDGQLPIRAPLGKRVTDGETLLAMSEEMERRFNSLILVSIFEALERFLKAVYAKLLFQLRGRATLPSKREFHASHRKARAYLGTPQYLADYVKYACRHNCDEAMAAFCKHLDWNSVVHNGWWDMTWDQFVSVMGFCRHRIIHTHGRVSVDNIRTLNAAQRKFVESCLHYPVHDLEQALLPPSAVIDRCFEVIVSHSWGLYILVTNRCGMMDESLFFRAPGTKRKVKPHM
jgi:hypothetical protein